jgi:hypothetical protein
MDLPQDKLVKRLTQALTQAERLSKTVTATEQSKPLIETAFKPHKPKVKINFLAIFLIGFAILLGLLFAWAFIKNGTFGAIQINIVLELLPFDFPSNSPLL